ncbi:hypothetical protein [Shimazuella alba]|uniref:Uncharacterized protein n=1 Tax=Shimazuella alba TaxID=2690964 RepID=A0A6I4VQW8_9BACL|nr:hypothetical protein [Shimazuella alba]MXQ53483.1 hypothetical protein [Shimazuella alba]
MNTIRNRYWEILIKEPFKMVMKRPDDNRPKYWLEANSEVYLLIVSSSEVLAHKVEYIGSENVVGNPLGSFDWSAMKDNKEYSLGKIAKVKKLSKK